MVIGARTCFPLAGGLIFGICMSLFMFPPQGLEPKCQEEQFKKEPIDSSEFWKVRLEQPPPADKNRDPQPKVVRARFAATELGMRERLAILILAQSSLSISLNASLAGHVQRVQVFADASRVDAEWTGFANLSPYRTGGQHSHVPILQTIHNLSLHEKYDWFLLVKDTTYVNPFELFRFINQVNWHEAVVVGAPELRGSCQLDASILLSQPAMRRLVENRVRCTPIDASMTDDAAFELCIQSATNLNCQEQLQETPFVVWQTPSTLAAHDAVSMWSSDPVFNKSITVTHLLSQSDSRALHDHFVNVEMDRMDEEIVQLAEEVESLFDNAPDGPSWPIDLPKYSVPPNRYQVATWDFFTLKDIFLSEPNQNVRPLEGKNREDVEEVLAAARAYVENGPEGERLEFVQMRNGYRLFDPVRGMDYMIDLVYKEREGNEEGIVAKRVHLSRPIAATQLVQQVPYVKEDTDMVIVIPVQGEDEVLPARRLLARHARLCTAPVEESRKTRLVVATSEAVDQRSITYMNNDLEELKRRCRRSALEAIQLTVKVAKGVFMGRALDVAVDHYGPATIFLLLSPYADVQKEFFDRTRINTIKKYQVFFPIPFVEYHPTISGMDVTEAEVPHSVEEARDAALARLRDSTPPKRKRPLLVQKDHGRFDSLDFTVFSVYGTDYVQFRDRVGANRMDLITAFLAQNELHILRAVEPTLRLRYHPHACDADLAEEDYARCIASRKENVNRFTYSAGLAYALPVAILLYILTTQLTLSDEPTTNMSSPLAAALRVVYVTVPTEEIALKISRSIVTAKLAACVNIVDGVKSVYEWEGKVHEDSEKLLIIKTQAERIEELQTKVKELHPYEVPEFLAIPVAHNSEPYEKEMSTPSRSDWSLPSAFTVAWTNLLATFPKKSSPLDIDPPRNTLRRHSATLSGPMSTNSDVYYLHSYGSLNLP
ncbi:unnamed protein product, partial [Mesorhabditis belari]|uniref:Hexosyltransferase n=1 Tax=Mesorhabditis belari TaxID=2138241 RepID=A0AAF3E8A4_9BILA